MPWFSSEILCDPFEKVHGDKMVIISADHITLLYYNSFKLLLLAIDKDAAHLSMRNAHNTMGTKGTPE